MLIQFECEKAAIREYASSNGIVLDESTFVGPEQGWDAISCEGLDGNENHVTVSYSLEDDDVFHD